MTPSRFLHGQISREHVLDRALVLSGMNIERTMTMVGCGSGDPDVFTRDEIVSRYDEMVRDGDIVDDLRAKPVIEQRSAEWLETRHGMVTASDLGQMLGRGGFRSSDDLLRKKASDPVFTPGVPKINSLRWGVMYESIADRTYRTLMGNVDVHEFGLIPHDRGNFGASPDGITSTGVMVEYKCPISRTIGRGVPDGYELQIQGQLEVAKLDICDYLECKIKEYESVDDYQKAEDPDAILHHGCVVEKRKKDDFTVATFIYSPEFITPGSVVNWACEQTCDDDYEIVLHFWRLDDYWMSRVRRDPGRMEEIFGHLDTFWARVVDARKAGGIPDSSNALFLSDD